MRILRIRAPITTSWLAIVLLFSHPGISFASSNIPNDERQALLALFQATHGERWRDVDGWISDDTGGFGPPGTECEWSGVKCNDAGTHVVSISLRESRLVGRIPSVLYRLSKLEVLDLSFNRLEGEIPKALLALRELKRLDLSGNRLSGRFPRRWRALPRLEELKLSNNYLSGNIRRFLGLRRLVFLDLSRNHFTGGIPKKIGRLTALEILALSRNHLTGKIPPQIGRLQALTQIYLDRNELVGSLPEEIGRLKNLDTVDLSYNHFSDIPSTSFHALDVTYLSVAHNELQGIFPYTVCTDSLRGLDLSWNRLRGTISSEITLCKGLRTLNVSHNRFEGELIPEFWQALSDVESLDLSNNQFTGSLPDSFDGTDLSSLDVSSNSFTGDISRIKWPELRLLRMDHNQFSGSISPSMLTESLRELTLSSNRLTGSIPESLCQSTSLRVLDLSHNRFNGTVCQTLNKLEDLNVVDLSDNGFTGVLPANLLDLPELTTLSVSNNAFEGALPDNRSSTALQVFEVSDNHFRGELPIWIEELRLLRLANFRNNAFTSGLARLAKLRNLLKVDVRDNPWQEPIPEKLAVLQNTQITRGSIPTIDPRLLITEKKPAPRGVGVETHIQPKVTMIGDLPGRTDAVLGGVVTDPEKTAAANAKVSAQSAKGYRATTTTDDSGHYELTLPAGEYRLTFEMSGFKQAVYDKVNLVGAKRQALDISLNVGYTAQAVEVAASTPESEVGPFWQSWLTQRGADESAKETNLQPNHSYSFYLEMSSMTDSSVTEGSTSAQIGASVRQALLRAATEGLLRESFLVRIAVVGRAAVLSNDVNSVSEWSPLTGGWTPNDSMHASAVLVVDISAVLSNTGIRRGGAVSFGIEARDSGCAVIALSIWDKTRAIPLDQVVRVLTVGNRQCGEIDQQQVSQGLYSASARNATPDVSLHVVEFKLDNQPHSASFMSLRIPVAPCQNYNWSSDASLSDQVLNNGLFKSNLDEARRDDVSYSAVGEQIFDAVFPSAQRSNVTCGDADAFKALKNLTQQRDVRMFAQVVDDVGNVAMVPLGLIAMYLQGGQRVFPHEIYLFEPLARETLSETECVSRWTFMLPPKLKGVDDADLRPPPRLSADNRIVRTRDDFVRRFIAPDNTDDKPSGLLLLAHHRDGVLTFSAGSDLLSFNRFDRDFGNGSIAVLSACETSNLTGSTKLVTRLNAKGMDALIASPFEVDAKFGAKFAFAFAEFVARNENREVLLEDAFFHAISEAEKDMAAITSPERARGMGLELVLAGNPKLKICSVSPSNGN